MVDINRSGSTDIVLANDELKKKWIEIAINEKINQIKNLDLQIERLDSVVKKEYLLKQDTLRKEIESLTNDLKAVDIG